MNKKLTEEEKEELRRLQEEARKWEHVDTSTPPVVENSTPLWDDDYVGGSENFS